jgi:hypothetical protein
MVKTSRKKTSTGFPSQYGLITAGLNNFDAITRKSPIDDDGRALLVF